jgi:hypothetical protein
MPNDKKGQKEPALAPFDETTTPVPNPTKNANEKGKQKKKKTPPPVPIASMRDAGMKDMIKWQRWAANS